MLLHVFGIRFRADRRNPSRTAPASTFAGIPIKQETYRGGQTWRTERKAARVAEKVSFPGKRDLKCRIEHRRFLRLIIICRRSISMLKETPSTMRFHLAVRGTEWRHAGVAFTSACKNYGNEMLSVQALTSSKRRPIARHSSCVGMSQCVDRVRSNRIGICTISAGLCRNAFRHRMRTALRACASASSFQHPDIASDMMIAASDRPSCLRRMRDAAESRTVMRSHASMPGRSGTAGSRKDIDGAVVRGTQCLSCASPRRHAQGLDRHFRHFMARR
jgi:hypothetical protein